MLPPKDDVVQWPMNVISYDSFIATPWKNGGGITHEAIRVPACGDPFLWRLSVAEIEKSGPFSDFAGYQRKMALLRGNGIALSFRDGARRELRRPGELVEFDGGMPTQCELLDGACMDLNLMVRNGIKVEARVQEITNELTPIVAAGETLLIFPIDRPVVAQGFNGDAVELSAWDLAVVLRGNGGLADLNGGLHSPAPSLVFLATMYA